LVATGGTTGKRHSRWTLTISITATGLVDDPNCLDTAPITPTFSPRCEPYAGATFFFYILCPPFLLEEDSTHPS
jgi:hypothetical protein